MSKPSHRPREGQALKLAYPEGSPVWVWSPFYDEWLEGEVTRGDRMADAVWVRGVDSGWVDDPTRLAPREKVTP